MTTPELPNQDKRGFFLKYRDYKKLEEIIESYHLFPESHDLAGEVDFNSIPNDEKDLLWKIKTIIRNMESVRLRATQETEESELERDRR